MELVIGHGCWLGRGDFVGEFVDGDGGADGEALRAWIDWTGAAAALDVGRLPGSGSEARMLRIAASLAEGVAVDLGEAVGGLGAHNVALVARAVLHAAGHRDAHAAPSVGVGR